MKSYSRTEADLRKEARQEEKKRSLAAGISEIECLAMFVVLYSWIDKHPIPWDSGRPITIAICIIVDLVLLAVGVLFVWASIVHMNHFAELKRKNTALDESLRKEKETAIYWKERYHEERLQ